PRDPRPIQEPTPHAAPHRIGDPLLEPVALPSTPACSLEPRRRRQPLDQRGLAYTRVPPHERMSRLTLLGSFPALVQNSVLRLPADEWAAPPLIGPNARNSIMR